MPVLRYETAIDFHNYIQRKVREHFPDWQTYSGTDRYTKDRPFRLIESVNSPPATQGINGLSARVSTLLEICALNDICVKVKLDGVTVDLTDSQVTDSIINDARKLILKTPHNISSRLTGRKMDYSITCVRSGKDNESGRQVGILSWLIFRSALSGVNNNLVFPSGKLTNTKKETETCQC